MKRSTDRILTTHVGSLPRPSDLLAMNTAKATGQNYDEGAWKTRVKSAVEEVVQRQAQTGIDVIDDGEQSKPNWSGYVMDRLTGFEAGPNPHHSTSGVDRRRFCEFYEEYDRINAFRQPLFGSNAICTGPVSYKGNELLRADIENLKSAAARVEAEDLFMPSIAPGTLIQRRNEYYRTEEEYLTALADAMKVEYRAIVEAGFILSLDDPNIVVGYDRADSLIDPESYRTRITPYIEALNYALAGIPEDRVRYHVCWGGWHGAHSTDFPLVELMPVLLRAKAGGYLIEAANAQHEHEWQVWQHVKLPEGRLVMPGVVSHATNVIEHPDLVAERIVRFANVLGKQNIVASTDCGMGGRVHQQIAWAKLASLVEGARRATKILWH
ncbi:MAG: epoxyalkane--coenzyme M transferase [Betaproteobacteria bacterium]|nr:epoxyalkane--coenzyme M transferase [Betaproteobacteria bacterium]